MIQLDHVSYTYPTGDRPALDGCSLSVTDGEFCGVIGASGSGKSTLAYALAGFIPHVLGGDLDGKLSVGGHDVVDVPLFELVSEVGLVLQNPFNQISGAKFTVREELAFGLENLGVERSEMISRTEAVLEELRITHLADRSPYELSGGQQQLVAIGAVMVMRPRVLVLDEPTSQLDPAGSRLVFTALHKLRQDGMTVVLIEHKLEQVAEFADRVVVLSGGAIQLDGPPRRTMTDERLEAWGIGHTRYTTAARAARATGWWPAERELPVTFVDAVEGFRAARSERSA